MNGLYGYPMVSGMSGMSGVTDQVAFIYAVADGSKAREIEQMKRQFKNQEKRVRDQEKAISRMPSGQEKDVARKLNTQATVGISKARKELNVAIDNYNEVAASVKKYTASFVSPPRVGMAGLGLPQAVAAAIPTTLIIASAGAAIALVVFSLSALVNTFTNNEGIISQTARALRASGTPIKHAADAISNTAWAVVAITGAYVVYQLLSGRKTRTPKDPLGVRSPVAFRSPVYRKPRGGVGDFGEQVARRPIITPPPPMRSLKEAAWA